MSLNLETARKRLQAFEFDKLFIEELGWSRSTITESINVDIDGTVHTTRHLSQLAGVAVIEVTAVDGSIPDSTSRRAIHKRISEHHLENLLIFVDKNRTQSLWYWGKRDGRKVTPREHIFVKGQPGDLFMAKLGPMFVDLAEFDDDGNIDLVEISKKLKDALDIQRVTKKFYTDYQDHHIAFTELIEGIDDERDRRWYASVLMNRLMFIYFLQLKYFLDGGDRHYLENKLKESKRLGRDKYFKVFLSDLFFQGFAVPEDKRSNDVNKRLGKIRYLNGGLFLEHSLEQKYKNIKIPDKAFENLLSLFNSYSWSLDDTPGGSDDRINPAVLGYIFEKYINQKASNNQKAFGAYYTCSEITEYLCERTIHRLILDKMSEPEIPGHFAGKSYESFAELLLKLDAPMCRQLLTDVLPNLRILDPACGSGAFLVAAMRTLIDVYSAIFGKISFLHDRHLNDLLKQIQKDHNNVDYYIKKRIITDNLFGVDLMEEATEIAKLRLFLALVSSAESESQLEPLPNIDFNILTGNSLIGLLGIEDHQVAEWVQQGDLFFTRYHEVLAKKNRLIDHFRRASDTYGEAADLTVLRDQIDKLRADASQALNRIVVDEFRHYKIKFEEATWDAKKNKQGKKRRAVNDKDIAKQRPFHWGYEFDKVINEEGGFDIIITNPPWEVFQTDEKEFFQNFESAIKKKKLRIEDWKKQHAKLMKDTELRDAWLAYASSFPHMSAYFKNAEQYKNQQAYDAEGNKIASKINLYKLFTEQCVNLLRKGGQCGIVIPSGIYTDLGAKQLREMLFTRTQLTGLFCFENRREIFEGVHRSFKFVVLSFEKGGTTESFPAAFMRHDVEELTRFPQQGAVEISLDLIRKLSPDSISLMEFKSREDAEVCEKAYRHPLIGDQESGWGIRFTQEFNMTSDAHLFETRPQPESLPLYEGKQIWHYNHQFAPIRYWINKNKGRAVLLGRTEDKGQLMDYQEFRLGFRDIASNTNERTLVTTVIPPAMHGNKLPTIRIFDEEGNRLTSIREQVYYAGVLNSLVVDFIIRMKVTTTLNFFYLYQLACPRIDHDEYISEEITSRAARLMATTPEFDGLAKASGIESHKNGVVDANERIRMQAEIDGLVAILYELSELEFCSVLDAFPAVDQVLKAKALEAFRHFSPKESDDLVNRLISKDESNELEFKSSARYDYELKRKDKRIEFSVLKTVAAFLNTEGGELIIGVDDDGKVLGLTEDYQCVHKKNRDGYELFLNDLIFNSLGADLSPNVKLTCHTIDGKDIWRVSVSPSSEPIYLLDDNKVEQLYIRRGNSTVALNAKEVLNYSKKRWKD